MRLSSVYGMKRSGLMLDDSGTRQPILLHSVVLHSLEPTQVGELQGTTECLDLCSSISRFLDSLRNIGLQSLLPFRILVLDRLKLEQISLRI